MTFASMCNSKCTKDMWFISLFISKSHHYVASRILMRQKIFYIRTISRLVCICNLQHRWKFWTGVSYDCETSEIEWKEWVTEICMTILDFGRPKTYTRSKSKSSSVRWLGWYCRVVSSLKGKRGDHSQKPIRHFNNLVKFGFLNVSLQHNTLIFDLICAHLAHLTIIMEII